MHIEHLIFDLDNTLYPATAEMDAGIHDRMMECVAVFFGVSLEKASEMKKINSFVHFEKNSKKQVQNLYLFFLIYMI